MGDKVSSVAQRKPPGKKKKKKCKHCKSDRHIEVVRGDG